MSLNYSVHIVYLTLVTCSKYVKLQRRCFERFLRGYDTAHYLGIELGLS